MQLAKLILHDNLNENQSPKYEVGSESDPLIWDDQNKQIISFPYDPEGFIVPLSKSENNWDTILIEMFLQCTPHVIQSNSNDLELQSKIHSVFNQIDLLCEFVLKNPNTILPELDKIEYVDSELCPENIAFGLPRFCFIGVFVSRGKEKGISVINPDCIVRIELD